MLIKNFHKLLTEGTYNTYEGECPGEYKYKDYVVGSDSVGASPEDVQEEISELIDELIDIGNIDVLKVVAYFHAKFENIHPFADGNGRTGRLLMNYFLIIHNHPPIIIFEEDKQSYYQALENFDNELTLNPLINFLKTQTVKTWDHKIA